VLAAAFASRDEAQMDGPADENGLVTPDGPVTPTVDGKPVRTVEDDVQDRIALAAEPHREVSNEELTEVKPGELIQTKVKHGGEGTARTAGQVVKELADSGQLFEKAGPGPDWDGTNEGLPDGVDGAFLAERSKQTGEKLF
jgi:hypothetical protein